MKKLVICAWSTVLGVGVVQAAEPIEYLDWKDGKLVPMSCMEYEVVKDGVSVFAAGKTYVVRGEVATTSRIAVNGTDTNPSRLILCDGAILTASKGIDVWAAAEIVKALVICGQECGSGALVAQGGDRATGIGGDTSDTGGAVTINGGRVTATGGSLAAGIGGGKGGGGIVTINGGTVTATGGDQSAGIGGCWRCDGATVTINGGTVMATGSDYAAGIGGGDNGHGGGNVTINGGTVTAMGGSGGAGIGGGCYGACSRVVTINGGMVTATGGGNTAAGIGGGHGGQGGRVAINGGNVTAQGGALAAGIGGGAYAVVDPLTQSANGTLKFAEVVPIAVWVGDSAPGEQTTVEAYVADHSARYVKVRLGWQVGENVFACVTADGELVFSGTGAMDDFASAKSVPWDLAEVTSVTVGEGVTKVGANAFAGLADTVTVNGLSIAFQKDVASAAGASVSVIPDNMVLVAKETIAAAKAMAVQIANGQIELSVSVLSNADITAVTANWVPVKFARDAKFGLAADGTKLILPIPVAAQSGFMILQSGDGKDITSFDCGGLTTVTIPSGLQGQ